MQMSQDNKMPILLSMGSNLFMGGFLLILFMNISHSIYYKIPLSYHYFFGGKQLGGGKFFLLVIYALLIGLFGFISGSAIFIDRNIILIGWNI